MPHTFSTTAFRIIGEMILWAEAEPIEELCEADDTFFGLIVENDFREDTLDAWTEFLCEREPSLLINEL